MSEASRVREVVAVFLRLGVVAFGGPAAHTAMMRDELVRRRGWIDDARFLDLMGATNLIPGPNSTELAIHLGHERAGRRGLVLAGLCFILPAALIVTALAWVYVRYGDTPALTDLLRGVVPAVLAIVVWALVPLLALAVHRGRQVAGGGPALLWLPLVALADDEPVTRAQLLDAVSIGQVTPGPVFTTATFIGYLVAGLPGAFLATVAIFLPSFVVVGLLTRLNSACWSPVAPWRESSGASRS